MTQQSEERVLAHDDLVLPVGAYPNGDLPHVESSEQPVDRTGMVLASVAAALSAVAVIIMGALLFIDGATPTWPLVLAAAALLAALVALVAWRRQSSLSSTSDDSVIHLP